MRTMPSKTIITAFLLLCLTVTAHTQDFYGKLDVGYGSLLSPDVPDSGVRKGGFTAVLQALFGEDHIKYGAEFGVAEVYTSWDKNRLLLNSSLVLLPLLGAAEYDFSCDRTTPYVGISAGPYFALEQYNSPDSGSSASTSNTVYGGGCLLAGVKVCVTKNYDVNLSIRYSQINASENVRMLGIYAGFGAQMPFYKNKKSDNVTFPLKEKKTD